jgi:hypothetical protein
VRGQYHLSVPVIYFDITPWFERDLAVFNRWNFFDSLHRCVMN